MFTWYQDESGQIVDPAVIERLYDETNGQPGLTCWLGELLTEGVKSYHPSATSPIGMKEFEYVYRWATKGLPNSNILNIISKAKQEPSKNTVLALFNTREKTPFRYDAAEWNFLYMNGVVDIEETPQEFYARFACPLIQKRLFNYFANELFAYTGQVRTPFEDLSAIFTPQGLNLRGLATRFETYLKHNRDWLLNDAPKRKDLRVYEAVYHFCFYKYLADFMGPEHARVYPEFPTGNGKIDLLITYDSNIYGLELKSYTNERGYYDALEQAARYGKQLTLTKIWLLSFVEYVDDVIRQKYEVEYVDQTTGIKVMPLFVETGR